MIKLRRFIILAAALVVQTILGGIYAWSVFVPNLIDEHGISPSKSGLIFGTMIAVFTIATIAGAHILRKRGPRTTVIISSFMYVLGNLLASFSKGDYALIFLGIGIFVGISVGFGYVSVLGIGMDWFPRQRGIITGLLMAAFAGGALVLSTWAEHLLHVRGVGILSVFRLVGMTNGALLFFSAFFLKSLPRKQAHHTVEGDYFIRQLLSKEFSALFFGIFAGTFAGLLIIGNLLPLALEFGVGKEFGSLSVGLFSLGNVLGRLGWGVFHDTFGSRRSILSSLAFFAIALLPLLLLVTPGIFLIAAFFSGFGFGACFVLYASSITNFFGRDAFSRLYPICFLGYGLSGLISPGFGGWGASVTGSYKGPLLVSLLLLLVAFIVLSKGLPSENDNGKVPLPRG
jgi:MFS transporter, OFA family, oxalate/formate antiporter